MQTELLKADETSLQRAAELIRAGEVVGFPTETVYGLGANAFDENAVRKIFVAKGRPGDNPLIVHIAHIEEIYPLIDGPIPEAAKRLMDAYWPGPMTIILKKSAKIPNAVSAGLDTVGIRMPSHPVARAFLEKAGVPIAAPSANLSGRPSPTTAAHVMEDMNGRVPMIIDGGSSQVGLESTVLDGTVFPPRVLRPGGVTKEMIAEVCGSAEVDGSVLRPLKEGEVARSPGMKYRHYAPKGKVLIVRGSSENVAAKIRERYDADAAQGGKPWILALTGHMPLYGARRIVSLGKDAEEMAARLFDALREMDEVGAETIYSECVSTEGLGLAVMNRLGRAAAFTTLDV